MTDVTVGNVVFGNRRPFALIAGPCQMESRDHAFAMAGALKDLCGRLGIGLVYKSSFDKANRTSGKAARGIGLEAALAVLVGVPAPGFHVADAGHYHPEIPVVPAGLPSDLLERRPDVARAERRLAAANSRIGIAKASFFPSLRLTGSGGVLSADVDTLFKWDSRTWAIGPTLTLPLFQGGRNRSDLARARAGYDEAVSAYRQQVLVASPRSRRT